MLRKDLLIHNTKMLLEGLAIAGFQSNSTKSGTNQKKPKSGEQNYIKQKIQQSDIAFFSRAKNVTIYMG